MLNEICAELNNYFVKELYHGKFTIKDGQINCEEIQTGQYFRIIGSIFNDGVFVNSKPNSLLIDEAFLGTVCAMAVPREVLSLCEDIEGWCEKYKDIQQSPYQSESFGGYSYSKKAENTNSGVSSTTWQSVFKQRLNKWRKI